MTKTVVYYADGVHSTHNSRSTYAWIEKGQEFDQPTVSGRDRVNINGVINTKDVTDVTAIDCQSVNADLPWNYIKRHCKASTGQSL